MKISYPMSVDAKIADTFTDRCEELGLSKNRVTEKLWLDWLDSRSSKIIECAICSAKYSNKLPDCPQCLQKDNLKLREMELAALLKRKKKLEAWKLKGTMVSEKELIDIQNKIEMKKADIESYHVAIDDGGMKDDKTDSDS